MAVDNNSKLTKFKSATTIVTADYANSVYGGLHGSSEADNLAPDDPRVIGHVHDGVKADGHAGKIDLVDHVDNQLLNVNLADDAVTKRNVRETEYQDQAIPELEVIDGITYYYLDLTAVRTDFTFIEDDSPSSAASAISENALIRQRSQYYDGSSFIDIPDVWGRTTGRDFVFGSPSLEDIDDGGDGDSRFFFDKSKGTFHAGLANSTQWDEANRGVGTAVFGANNTAPSDASAAFGTGNSLTSSDYSAVFGLDNTVQNSEYSVVLGNASAVGSSNYAFVGPSDSSVIINNLYSSIYSGFSGEITDTSSPDPSFIAFHNSILSGSSGQINSSRFSYISGGNSNSIEGGQHSRVMGGEFNVITGAWSVSGGPFKIFSSSSKYSQILNGSYNYITDASYSLVRGGTLNAITISQEYNSSESPDYSSVFGKGATSYAYGQNAQSSGTFDPSDAPLNTFSTTFPPAGSEWVLLVPDQGGAQTFTMTMFGNFQYESTDLIPLTLNTPQTMIANLDNGQDSSSPGRPFRPRVNASYSIKTIGTISFSEPDPAPPYGPIRTMRHSVTFELHTGITVQNDGSILYNTDSFVITHDSRDLYGFGSVRFSVPGTTNPNDDFRLWFTHDTATPVNRSSALIGPPGLPPGYGFSFVLENRTFLNNGGPGTSSGSVLYGEALSARMDVTELNINLYRQV